VPCSTWKATSSPNIEYETCHEQGVYVPGAGPAYGQAVAEHPLGLALDLARGISREDRAFRAGRESYVSTSTEDSILLRHASVGLIGFGNLGRALRRLLIPFALTIRVYDPWLPDSLLREHDVLPATLEETLAASQFLFVLATVTGESEHLLGPAELDTVPAGARLILVSRAAVVDYDALLDRVRDGRFLAGVDVRPDEPVPADCPGGPPARSGPGPG
jgi:phosphoglycerate dehydrogenase-like enzyme